MSLAFSICIDFPPRRRWRASAAAALAVTLTLSAATAAAADVKTFARGSLIIPMTSVFQTQCGQVSAYGLVYRILEANGPGHRNASKPVTVYIINDSGKKSVNRCKPTNTASFAQAVESPADATWSDGCDLHVENTAEQPVVKVDFKQNFPAAGVTFKAGRLNTYDDANAWPRFSAFSEANLTKPKLTKVSYGGAPFVIDAADAQRVFDLLKEGDTGTRKFPEIATSTFTTSCHCSGLSTSTTKRTTTDGTLEYSDACHFVDIHQSTIAFRAIIERRLNLPPASFALYDPSYGRGTDKYYDTKRFSHAGLVDLNFVLEKYLKIAGLWLEGTKNGNDSRGCPVGNVSGCGFNGSNPADVGTPASEAQANRGVVFDRFTTEDLDYVEPAKYPVGILNRRTTASGSLAYVLFWAPHWEGYVNEPGEQGGDDRKGIESIRAFLASGGNILGECASVATWEDAAYGRAVGGPDAGSNFLALGGVSFFTLGDEYTPANERTGSNIKTGRISGWHNCSDPGQTLPCVEFPNQGNIFSQVGDWLFTWGFGALEAAKPLSTGYQPWAKPMLRVETGKADRNTLAANDYDVFIMGHETEEKGVVVYVGGHDVSGDVLGARIVLNSMLNLGGVPSSSERALAAPTIVYGSLDGGYVDQVLTPTYEAVSGRKADPAVSNFTSTPASDRKMWTWPYTPGHLRSHELSQLDVGTQRYTSALLFDSANLSQPTGIEPLPKGRNLFTWLGGYPAAADSAKDRGAVRNNQLQKGWRPELLDGTVLDRDGACGDSVSTCLDVMGFKSRVKGPVAYDDRPHAPDDALSMVVGKDGLCDVQQVMNFAQLASKGDLDSACGDEKARQADATAAAWILQRVRGYCDSGDDTNLTPTDQQCKDGQDNRAHLGGLVYSSAAVVGPSRRIIDQGGPRPTVAYVGGYDGQLHAFYVGGGQGYAGPPLDLAFSQDKDNAPTFRTQYAATFRSGAELPKPGTELWAFLPASQLPHLWDNTARVDSSPVVLDVFADFDASGIRRWHTLLLVSLGSDGTELLAIDVTDPLLPRLLWDSTGSLFTYGGSPKFSPNVLMTAANDAPLPGAAIAQKCVMARDPKTDDFKETCKLEKKLYDFQDLGGTAGLSASQIRVGLEPVYVVFAVSNMSAGRSGLEVHAVEASTGQLMWQWEHPYDAPDHSDRLHDNAVPPVATVITGADGAARVFVGDHEGRLWELDAATGKNLNTATTGDCKPEAPCQFPAFDTGSSKADPQPITTNIAVARVPPELGDDAPLAAYRGERVAIFGTAGADWLAAAEQVQGRVHVALLEAGRRVPIATGRGTRLDGKTPWSLESARKVAKTSGVLQEVPSFPVQFAKGERVYGAITVAGSVAYFTTATDKVASDVMQLPENGNGHTYTLNLGTANTKALAGTNAAYGGVAVYLGAGGELKGLVSSQMSTMNYQTSTSVPGDIADGSKRDPRLKVGDNQGLTYRLMAWLRRVLGP